MGCSITKEPPPASNLLDIPEVLTPSEKQLIRESWKRLSHNMPALGKQVFLYLFDRHPDVKELFPFRDIWGDQLLHHPQFVAHATRFIKIIESAVLHLDNLHRDYTLALLLLGQKHQSIEGFRPHHFEAFHHALHYIIVRELKDEANQKLTDAWRTLITFIIDKLKVGYNHSEFGRRLSTQYHTGRVDEDNVQNSLPL